MAFIINYDQAQQGGYLVLRAITRQYMAGPGGIVPRRKDENG